MELPVEGYPISTEAVGNWFRAKFGHEPTVQELCDIMLQMTNRDTTLPREGPTPDEAGWTSRPIART
jgi:hypothetical protein